MGHWNLAYLILKQRPMGTEEDFSAFKDRLRDLDKEIRERALTYARDFYDSGKMTREMALEKGITRAQIENRDL